MKKVFSKLRYQFKSGLRHGFKNVVFSKFFFGFVASLSMIISSYDKADRVKDNLNARFHDQEDTFDFIIVGAGTAGCLLANRLSEDHKVLLIEAGGEPHPLLRIPGLALFMVNYKETDWQSTTVPQRRACFACPDKRASISQGRNLGGSSNINWQVFLRGSPRDYNYWAQITGDTSWSYQEMLPYFKKSENYIGETPDREAHGFEGELMIDQPAYSGMSKEFIRAGQELGYEHVDLNARYEQGFDTVYSPIEGGERKSSFQALLEPVRDRENLVIRKYSHATKILVRGFDSTAFGVEYKRHGMKKYAYATKEIILSAGAVESAKLLMLSGIGPGTQLADLGIPIIADLPVGQNLQDHLSTFLGPFFVDPPRSFLIDRDISLRGFYEYKSDGHGPLASSLFQAAALISSHQLKQYGTWNWPDIQLLFSGMGAHKTFPKDLAHAFNLNIKSIKRYYEHAIGRDSFFIAVAAARPHGRGEVLLEKKDPYAPPAINPRYLENDMDMQTTISGIKVALQIVENTTSFQSLRARFTNRKFPGCDHVPFRSDEYWECYIRHYSVSMNDVVGTCAMGSQHMGVRGVVTSKLEVIGVNHLRVIDASIMPKIVASPTQAAVIAIAEKGADLILEAWKSREGLFHSMPVPSLTTHPPGGEANNIHQNYGPPPDQTMGPPPEYYGPPTTQSQTPNYSPPPTDGYQSNTNAPPNFNNGNNNNGPPNFNNDNNNNGPPNFNSGNNNNGPPNFNNNDNNNNAPPNFNNGNNNQQTEPNFSPPPVFSPPPPLPPQNNNNNNNDNVQGFSNSFNQATNIQPNFGGMPSSTDLPPAPFNSMNTNQEYGAPSNNGGGYDQTQPPPVGGGYDQMQPPPNMYGSPPPPPSPGGYKYNNDGSVNFDDNNSAQTQGPPPQPPNFGNPIFNNDEETTYKPFPNFNGDLRNLDSVPEPSTDNPNLTQDPIPGDPPDENAPFGSNTNLAYETTTPYYDAQATDQSATTIVTPSSTKTTTMISTTTTDQLGNPITMSQEVSNVYQNTPNHLRTQQAQRPKVNFINHDTKKRPGVQISNPHPDLYYNNLSPTNPSGLASLVNLPHHPLGPVYFRNPEYVLLDPISIKMGGSSTTTTTVATTSQRPPTLTLTDFVENQVAQSIARFTTIKPSVTSLTEYYRKLKPEARPSPNVLYKALGVTNKIPSTANVPDIYYKIMDTTSTDVTTFNNPLEIPDFNDSTGDQTSSTDNVHFKTLPKTQSQQQTQQQQQQQQSQSASDYNDSLVSTTNSFWVNNSPPGSNGGFKHHQSTKSPTTHPYWTNNSPHNNPDPEPTTIDTIVGSGNAQNSFFNNMRPPTQLQSHFNGQTMSQNFFANSHEQRNNAMQITNNNNINNNMNNNNLNNNNNINNNNNMNNNNHINNNNNMNNNNMDNHNMNNNKNMKNNNNNIHVEITNTDGSLKPTPKFRPRKVVKIKADMAWTTRATSTTTGKPYSVSKQTHVQSYGVAQSANDQSYQDQGVTSQTIVPSGKPFVQPYWPGPGDEDPQFSSDNNDLYNDRKPKKLLGQAAQIESSILADDAEGDSKKVINGGKRENHDSDTSHSVSQTTTQYWPPKRGKPNMVIDSFVSHGNHDYEYDQIVSSTTHPPKWVTTVSPPHSTYPVNLELTPPRNEDEGRLKALANNIKKSTKGLWNAVTGVFTGSTAGDDTDESTSNQQEAYDKISPSSTPRPYNHVPSHDHSVLIKNAIEFAHSPINFKSTPPEFFAHEKPGIFERPPFHIDPNLPPQEFSSPSSNPLNTQIPDDIYNTRYNNPGPQGQDYSTTEQGQLDSNEIVPPLTPPPLVYPNELKDYRPMLPRPPTDTQKDATTHTYDDNEKIPGLVPPEFSDGEDNAKKPDYTDTQNYQDSSEILSKLAANLNLNPITQNPPHPLHVEIKTHDMDLSTTPRPYLSGFTSSSTTETPSTNGNYFNNENNNNQHRFKDYDKHLHSFNGHNFNHNNNNAQNHGADNNNFNKGGDNNNRPNEFQNNFEQNSNQKPLGPEFQGSQNKETFQNSPVDSFNDKNPHIDSGAGLFTSEVFAVPLPPNDKEANNNRANSDFILQENKDFPDGNIENNRFPPYNNENNNGGNKGRFNENNESNEYNYNDKDIRTSTEKYPDYPGDFNANQIKGRFPEVGNNFNNFPQNGNGPTPSPNENFSFPSTVEPIVGLPQGSKEDFTSKLKTLGNLLSKAQNYQNQDKNIFQPKPSIDNNFYKNLDPFDVIKDNLRGIPIENFNPSNEQQTRMPPNPGSHYDKNAQRNKSPFSSEESKPPKPNTPLAYGARMPNHQRNKNIFNLPEFINQDSNSNQENKDSSKNFGGNQNNHFGGNNNKFANNQENNFKEPNHFTESQNNFAGAQNNFGASQTNFAETQNNFGENQNNFAGAPNNFGENLNNFAGAPNNFGESQNNFAETTNKFGENQNNFAGAPTNFEESQNNFAETPNKFGENQNNFAGSPNNFGENQNNFGNGPPENFNSNDNFKNNDASKFLQNPANNFNAGPSSNFHQDETPLPPRPPLPQQIDNFSPPPIINENPPFINEPPLSPVHINDGLNVPVFEFGQENNEFPEVSFNPNNINPPAQVSYTNPTNFEDNFESTTIGNNFRNTPFPPEITTPSAVRRPQKEYDITSDPDTVDITATESSNDNFNIPKRFKIYDITSDPDTVDITADEDEQEFPDRFNIIRRRKDFVQKRRRNKMGPKGGRRKRVRLVRPNMQNPAGGAAASRERNNPNQQRRRQQRLRNARRNRNQQVNYPNNKNGGHGNSMEINRRSSTADGEIAYIDPPGQKSNSKSPTQNNKSTNLQNNATKPKGSGFIYSNQTLMASESAHIPTAYNNAPILISSAHGKNYQQLPPRINNVDPGKSNVHTLNNHNVPQNNNNNKSRVSAAKNNTVSKTPTYIHPGFEQFTQKIQHPNQQTQKIQYPNQQTQKSPSPTPVYNNAGHAYVNRNSETSKTIQPPIQKPESTQQTTTSVKPKQRNIASIKNIEIRKQPKASIPQVQQTHFSQPNSIRPKLIDEATTPKMTTPTSEYDPQAIDYYEKLQSFFSSFYDQNPEESSSKNRGISQPNTPPAIPTQKPNRPSSNSRSSSNSSPRIKSDIHAQGISNTRNINKERKNAKDITRVQQSVMEDSSVATFASSNNRNNNNNANSGQQFRSTKGNTSRSSNVGSGRGNNNYNSNSNGRNTNNSSVRSRNVGSASKKSSNTSTSNHPVAQPPSSSNLHLQPQSKGLPQNNARTKPRPESNVRNKASSAESPRNINSRPNLLEISHRNSKSKA